MYAHGPCLYVCIVAECNFNITQRTRYIQVCKSVPESQSNGISVLGAPGST